MYSSYTLHILGQPYDLYILPNKVFLRWSNKR